MTCLRYARRIAEARGKGKSSVLLAMILGLAISADAQHTFKGYSEYAPSFGAQCPGADYKFTNAGCCPGGYAIAGVGVLGGEPLCRKLPTLAATTEYIQSASTNDASGVVACRQGDYAIGHYYDEKTEFLVCHHSDDIRLDTVRVEAAATNQWSIACSQVSGSSEMVAVAVRIDFGFLCSAVKGWKTPKQH